MLDQTQGIRNIIDRLDVPPRLRILITELEHKAGPIDKVPEKGGAEVRKILQLTDGATLCAAIVAQLLEQIDVADLPPEPINQDKTLFQRWSAAAAKVENLALLLVDSSYIAFGEQAERIADTIETHIVNVGGNKMVALEVDKQSAWESELIEKHLDVSLMQEDGDEFLVTALFAEDEEIPAE